MTRLLPIMTCCLALCLVVLPARAQGREKLDRGLVAVYPGEGQAYVSWRLLPSDPPNVAFNLYRRQRNDKPVRVNKEPIARTTDFFDQFSGGIAAAYSVRAVIDGQEGPPSAESVRAEGPNGTNCISIPLPDKATFQKFNAVDLDGDGRLEYVIKRPGGNIDPWHKYWKKSEETYKIEAYAADGKRLWTHDMGWSIETGIWYSPFVAWDLDGDGKAEVACKAGEGDPRDAEGKVRSGPEYLAILDGATGKVAARCDWPDRKQFELPGQNAEASYNYASRNQMAVAYLDGRQPSLIVNRGTYNLIVIEAYDYRGGKLSRRWRWSNKDLDRKYWGQGAHYMHAVDVDGDGRDEILFGSACLDDDGKEMWTTGLGHPDHLYVGDLDPQRPGLEVYYGIESARKDRNGMCMVCAKTGKVLWGHQGPTRHVHSHGMCSDVDPAHPGAECYSADTDADKKAAWGKTWSAQGKVVSEELMGFGLRVAYWDADPQRELLAGGGKIRKWKGPEVGAIRGSFVAAADILGDWREEIVTSSPGEMRIYVSTIPADCRRTCLLSDALYRMDTVVGTMGYYQVPMLSYDLAGAKPLR